MKSVMPPMKHVTYLEYTKICLRSLGHGRPSTLHVALDVSFIQSTVRLSLLQHHKTEGTPKEREDSKKDTRLLLHPLTPFFAFVARATTSGLF